MKQILLSLATVALMAPALCAQNTALHDFIDKYRHDQAFSYAFLSKDLFDVAIQSGIEDQDWKKLHQVVRNIGSLSILAADSLSSAPALYKEALAAVPATDFDELLAVQDGKDRVRIWARDEGNVVTDLVLLVGTADEFVLVCFTGNLELDNLTALAGLFDAGSVEQLAKTSQTVAADFSIGPNPTPGTFTLHYPAPDDQPAQMSVLDQNGRQLSMQNLSGEASQQIALPDLPAGLYWIQLKAKSGKVGVKQLQIVR